ncbi:peroxiredoxin-like [Leptopilina heterotoma]|uniref:peroxiredoxin-like n=1 Tax=Leptopilina heterotoma TaxID=63436 RepID=UPI001CA91B08|nr:peroxiredoxin-like [Leptopilina heterotoma]
MHQISLQDFKDKYLILLFYPCDFSFTCPSELIQFSDRIEEFKNIGAEIVAVSTDSKFAHFVWTTTPRKQGGIGEINIPLLSDKNHSISKKYGVLDENSGSPLGALFIIDNKQILRHVTINDPAIPRSVDEVLRVIKNAQFIEKYGDICPLTSKENSRLSENDNRDDCFQI